MARADRLMVPAINGRSYVLEADIDFGSGDAQGAILAFGNRFGGMALYCHAGDVVFDYVYSEAKTYRLRYPQPTGRQQVRVGLELTGERAGTFHLHVPQAPSPTLHVPRLWTTYGVTAGLTCGYLNVPIVPECPLPATFTGVLHSVDLHLLGAGGEDPGAFAALMQEE
jgi:hypothetical protein